MEKKKRSGLRVSSLQVKMDRPAQFVSINYIYKMHSHSDANFCAISSSGCRSTASVLCASNGWRHRHFSPTVRHCCATCSTGGGAIATAGDSIRRRATGCARRSLPALYFVTGRRHMRARWPTRLLATTCGCGRTSSGVASVWRRTTSMWCLRILWTRLRAAVARWVCVYRSENTFFVFNLF